MKATLAALVALAVLASFTPAEARSYQSAPDDVYVHGYERGDGTYVQPHYRSHPDGNPDNNYGSGD